MLSTEEYDALAHTTDNAMDTLRNLRFGVLEHSLCSPDLFQLDYHLFDPLNEALRGQRFESDEVKSAVHAWFAAKPNTFFSQKI